MLTTTRTLPMSRRYWPRLLAIASLAILGSYLLYTEHLVREIRAEAQVHTRMYALVQRGLLSLEEDGPLAALAGLQGAVQELGVPIVVLDAQGRPSAVANLPFSADLNTAEGRERVVSYARRLARQNEPIFEPGAGVIYFGRPPILRWLRWVPWLQVGAAVLLLWVSLGLIRADLRAEREQMWAAMARELAHQMGTPLSSLAGWVELLRMPASERATLASPEHIAREIAADLERLERVTRRFELIGKPPALTRVPVAEIVADLERYMRPRLPRLASGVDLRMRVQDPALAVHGNRVLLVWALENLLKNALDALAGRGGRIRVAARRAEDGWVRLYVTDTGPGIPPHLRDRIFEPGVTTKAGGWGVGLSLVRRIIVNVHGGRIVTRPRRGAGTVFQIDLPGDDAAARARRRRGALGWLRRRKEVGAGRSGRQAERSASAPAGY
ncbi:MAG TPA: HAMP domain-containing sensor histidine kinase [Longimicrobiales bacterium]